MQYIFREVPFLFIEISINILPPPIGKIELYQLKCTLYHVMRQK